MTNHPITNTKSPMQTLIIGCGNLLRGDDAVGPLLIRHLWERGVPPQVRIADGGTAGMDVAFQMRGADRVILIDACQSGSPPGAIFQVPGDAVAELPPLDGINLHAFRWDHALAFARWLLKADYPTNITVYLIEAANFGFGDDLSTPVRQAMNELIERLLADLQVAYGSASA